ncbi:hypothetical protein C7E25_21735, partial [Stenotrophomonas maltophilia]
IVVGAGHLGALAVTEFFADKIPGVDSAWDLVQTLARVPAGAFLAAATLSPAGLGWPASASTSPCSVSAWPACSGWVDLPPALQATDRGGCWAPRRAGGDRILRRQDSRRRLGVGSGAD